MPAQESGVQNVFMLALTLSHPSLLLLLHVFLLSPRNASTSYRTFYAAKLSLHFASPHHFLTSRYLILYSFKRSTSPLFCFLHRIPFSLSHPHLSFSLGKLSYQASYLHSKDVSPSPSINHSARIFQLFCTITATHSISCTLFPYFRVLYSQAVTKCSKSM